MGNSPNDKELEDIIKEVLADASIVDRAAAQVAIEKQSGGRPVDIIWGSDLSDRRVMFQTLGGRVRTVWAPPPD